MNHTTAAVQNQPTPESLVPMTWQQARVITTDLLARLYGTEAGNIRENFSANSDRFVEGKHFFKLEGSTLREFKNCVSNPDAVPKHTRNLVLWTERGAARHAKMLDTDAAWEVFEKLEDCYFQVKETVERATYSVNPGDVLTAAQAEEIRLMVKTECEKLPKDFQAEFNIKAWSKLKSHFGVTYRKIPQREFTEALSLVARHAASYPQVHQQQPLKLGFNGDPIRKPQDNYEQMHNRALQLAEGCYLDAFEEMRRDQNCDIRFGKVRIEDWTPNSIPHEVADRIDYVVMAIDAASKMIQRQKDRIETQYGKSKRAA